jgi:hypothetical protein
MRNIEKINEFCDQLFEIDRPNIKNRGYPLIKKFLKVDLNKLTIDRRTKYLALCFDKDFLSDAARVYDLEKLYLKLNKIEKEDFESLLLELAKENNYLRFQQEVYLFLRKFDLDASYVASRINQLANERY